MATALVVGNMIGSGVFLLPSSLAPYGAMSLAAWVFTAAGAILLALVFARLSRHVRATGGPYVYTRAAFGDYAGFLVGWGYWLSIIVGNAAIAVAATSYLGVFWPALTTHNLLAALVTIGIVWILTIVNAAGVRKGGSLQLATTVFKLLPLLLLATVGFASFDPTLLGAPDPATGSPLGSFTAAAALTLWAFLGLESATIPSEDVENAGKTIPRATVLGTLVAAIVYIASTTAVMGIVPRATLAASTAPFADAARMILGSWAGKLVAAGAAISAIGALNGWTLLQGQMPLASARDGLAPAVFSRLSARGTPVTGLVVSSVLVSVMVMANFTKGLVPMFTFLILFATLLTLIPYVFSSMALLVLERRATGTKLGAGIVVLASLAFAYSLWTVVGAGREAIFWGLLFILGSTPIYVVMRLESPGDSA